MFTFLLCTVNGANRDAVIDERENIEERKDYRDQTLTLLERYKDEQLQCVTGRIKIVVHHGSSVDLLCYLLSKRAFANLESLSMTNNNIGDSGITVLAKTCANLSSLKNLWLDGNQIGNGGIVSLVGAVSALHNLEGLFLDGNQIGNVGIVSLAGAVSTIPNLKDLFLQGNSITADGINALADAVSNGALASLQMIGVDIKGHPKLVAACRGHGIKIV